ncbi:hypothetical protein NL364_30275, partial [Klebsiella pneumoniae]|nr:hypothetical protein [Klebsiella pneumoniae]
VGALFLRVYENSLLRQTETELVAQSAALAAVAARDWPGGEGVGIVRGGYASDLDLRLSRILPERPAPVAMPGADRRSLAWAGE